MQQYSYEFIWKMQYAKSTLHLTNRNKGNPCLTSDSCSRQGKSDNSFVHAIDQTTARDNFP